MNLAICISVKNRSNLVVNQEDPIETYKHIASNIQDTPSEIHFPPTLNKDGTITLNLLPKLLMSLMSIKEESDNWTVIIVDYCSTDVNVSAVAKGMGGILAYQGILNDPLMSGGQSLLAVCAMGAAKLRSDEKGIAILYQG